MRAQVPVGKLPIVAGDECIEQNCSEQCICSCSARGILIRPVLEHPVAGEIVESGHYAGAALPIESSGIGGEGSLELPVLPPPRL